MSTPKRLRSSLVSNIETRIAIGETVDALMSVQEVAEHLQVPIETVRRWRKHGDGPPGFRVGKHLRYRRESVDAWVRDLEQRDPAPAA